MKQVQEPRRRIVGLGEYAVIKIRHKGRVAAPALAFILCLTCMLVLGVAGQYLMFQVMCWLCAAPEASGAGLGGAAAACLIACLCVIPLMKRSDAYEGREEDVVLRVRADPSDLTDAEGLLRASQEPDQRQQAVLLRAATQTHTGQEDQLLRATSVVK